MSYNMTQVGIVVIGRNEGPRLKRCFQSLEHTASSVVYVDSGSTDASVALALSMGIEVVQLDMSIPFTMGRARNEGWRHLNTTQPHLELVQFVDGDCELEPQWLNRGCHHLAQDSNIVAVCGRCRERHRDTGIYHRLIDMELDVPIGQVRSCHGNVLMRLAALQATGGFDPSMIAGEEPELCIRLRQQGGTILRVDEPMTIHDAAMNRFCQWWKRSIRCGHANAHCAALHSRSSQWRHVLQPAISAIIWGFAAPIMAITAAITSFVTPAATLICALVACGYGLLTWRIYRWRRIQDSRSDALLYTLFCIVAKFPEFIGITTFCANRLRGRHTELIEYKAAQQAQYVTTNR